MALNYDSPSPLTTNYKKDLTLILQKMYIASIMSMLKIHQVH